MSGKKYSARNRPRYNQKGNQTVRLILVGAAFIALAVYANWDSKRVAEPLVVEAVFLEGEKIFAQNCAACHGEQGEGHAAVAEAPALNGNEHAWHHADGQLQALILGGGTVMPSFQDELTNQEVIAVIRYFQTLWRPYQLQAQQSNSVQDPLRE